MTIRRMFFYESLAMSRLGIAVGSLLWAVILALPTELFPTEAQRLVGAGRVTYTAMATIAPELVWAGLFLVHALWSFYTLVTGTRNSVTLAADGFLGCILWTSSTAACFVSHWPHGLPFMQALSHYQPPAAMSGEVVMSFYAWWHMIRFWAEEETDQHSQGA